MFDFTSGPYSGLGTPQQSIGFPGILGLDLAGELIGSMADGVVLLGVDGSGQPITVDLNSESPHVLINAGTGGGKSVTARSFACQVAVQGGMVVILDRKQHSHRWASKLRPNVSQALAPGEIGNALVQLGKELHKRNEIVKRWSGSIESAPVGPPIAVIFEEMNSTIRELKDLDKRLPEGNYRSIDAFRDVMHMGRAVKIHVIGSAQLATFRDMGGAEIVEGFGYKAMIRYSPQAWKWLASDCGRPVSAPQEAGRAMVCYGGKARETQLLYLTEDQVVDLVLASPRAQALAHHLSIFRAPAIWRSAVRGLPRGTA
jgi:Rad3-related DNA helicase